jgi:hypothetical protein
MNKQDPLFELPEPPSERTGEYTLEGEPFPARQLGGSDREIQAAVMREWFYRHFEDPVQSCPYISSEGGYQYIYGGPYDAHEQLEQEFSGVVDDEVIEKLSDELSDESPNWSGSSDNFSSDLDDYLFRSGAQSFGQEYAFKQSALNIERLLETRVEAAEVQCMLRLLYVNVITALETYLSDKFMSAINADEKLLRRFIETTPEFKSRKFSLSEVFSVHESIKKDAETHLVEVVWHRLDKVAPMFRDTLGVSFPADMSELYKALIVRHDCVHRNGKTKEGQEHVLSDRHVKDLLSEADRLVEWIEAGGRQPTGQTPSLDVPF